MKECWQNEGYFSYVVSSVWYNFNFISFVTVICCWSYICNLVPQNSTLADQFGESVLVEAKINSYFTTLIY